jgi:hypothetical protein
MPFSFFNKTKKIKSESQITRMRIKTLCLPSNKLFQVPFKKEQIKRYKGISDCITHDCFFQVMTVLGLRHYMVSRKDSLRVDKTNSKGVETRDAAKYLATIFNAHITTKYILKESIAKKFPLYKNLYIPRNKEPIDKQLNTYLNLDNGYATFVCGLYWSTSLYGHFFIIYKENNIIYYYDQSAGLNTTNVYKINNHDKFVGFFLYYNESKESCLLLKDKISTNIPI